MNRSHLHRETLVTLGQACQLLEQMQEFWRNGTPVHPGSLLADEANDLLKRVMEGPPITPDPVKPLDTYENALVQRLKSPGPRTLEDVVTIYAWRCAIEPDYAATHLLSIAEWLWKTVDRLDLWTGGMSGSQTAFGLLCDAAPAREWALLLQEKTGPLSSPDRVYWWRIISVLCSRLYMAEVKRLPGYNHDATDGPFGIKTTPCAPSLPA